MIAIATQALACVIDAPSIEASQESATVMDTAPAQIGTAGTPTVVAAPTISVFQTDAVSVKFRQPVAWALRSPSAVAWIEGATW